MDLILGQFYLEMGHTHCSDLQAVAVVQGYR